MKKELKYYIITSIITMCLLLFLYSQIGVFENSIFTSDSYSQYLALFEKLKRIISSTDSLFYSFQGGLGGSFLGTIFYYLCSPFNLLLFFFEDMQKFVVVITLLKFLVASLTALYFFRYHFKEESTIYAILFSILYVFISFNVLHFIHIMWLDAVLMLPLLLVGIDKFIKKKNILPYVLPLIYIIVTNYYFGYMACIFSFLYFNYQLLSERSIKSEIKDILKQNVLFIAISILAVLCTSFVLFEIVHYLPGYARTTTEFLNGEKFIFHGNPFHFLESFLLGATQDIDFLNADKFFLYFSILGFLLVILYFANPEIKGKEKILTFLMIFILYLSVSANYFNYAWHGFAKPQFFNGRFTFLFCFFLLFIAIKSLSKISHLTKKSYLLSILFITIMLFIYYITKKDTIMMYSNLGLFVAYLLLLYFIKTEKVYMPLIIITLAILEVESNAFIELNKYSFVSKENYYAQNETYRYAINDIKVHDKSPFYRIENNVTDPYNGPIYYNYNGIDIFLSTIQDEMANFFNNMGLGSGSTKKNTISYYTGNKIMDSLFGIKYQVLINDYSEIDGYELITEEEIQSNTIRIYKNPNSLSLGFMVNSKILDVKKDLNALQYQNNILKAMIDSKVDIFENISLTEEGNYYYSFENTKKKDMCFYTAIDSSNGYNNFTLYLNDDYLEKTEDWEIICTESSNKENLELSYTNLDENQHLGTFAAYYDEEAWKNTINSLKEQELNIIEFKDNKIKGTVTSTKEKDILFTTIPYDDNWNVYIDGEKVKTEKVLDALLGVKIDSGTHSVEFKYRPKQFYLGLCVSIISFIILVIIDKKKLLQPK